MSWFFGPEDPGWELLPYDLQTRVHVSFLKQPAFERFSTDDDPDDDLDEPLVIKFHDESGNVWLI